MACQSMTSASACPDGDDCVRISAQFFWGGCLVLRMGWDDFFFSVEQLLRQQGTLNGTHFFWEGP